MMMHGTIINPQIQQNNGIKKKNNYFKILFFLLDFAEKREVFINLKAKRLKKKKRNKMYYVCF